MNNNGGLLVTGLIVLLLVVQLNAQQKKAMPETKVATGTNVAKKKGFRPDVYLGNGTANGGKYTVPEFSALLKRGIHSQDSVGNKYKIIGFNFNYAERKLYEDSTGELAMLVDYSSEFCLGDTVSKAISETIYERLKGGDTVYIDKVQLTHATAGKAKDTFLGKSMKFELLK